jgi:hypothetical protein
MVAPSRFATEDQFQEFCELLERKDDEVGRGFYPTKLYPHRLMVKGSGGAVGLDVSKVFGDFSFSEVDKCEAGPLLSEVQAARVRFSRLSKKHCRVLDKAEGIWKGLAE